ncbi:MAG: 2-isopropylmalate synthase [Leptospiraceae bacterium]|nr:2-isopropylmalate synthase [Leptospiraceae bacterium]MBK7057910.1 2-isopropylmalate synthase [Leptospiraceae bacterium]MBP9164010.1 2-isopropylmalate synthase [Leptospiraceae bacterium]
MNETKLEILDVTLRDGEQTQGVVFSTQEKLNIAKFLLLNAKVDRVEVASARVSRGEKETVKTIMKWAEKENLSDRIEILGFVDKTASVDWIVESGAHTLNLLTKGSEKHLIHQLKKTPEEHLSEIKATIDYALSKGIQVNVYMEDWSNGFLNSPDYVAKMATAISNFPIQRLFLPDTLGVLSPDETSKAMHFMKTISPSIRIEFHGHNDYDLSVANCLAAVNAGVSGLHVSVNGLGERAGNSPLEAVITAVHDKLGIRTNVVESEITALSRLVEVFSGKRISDNRPIVGQDVFTQTAGVHADGDKKGNLYANPILPERFGRKRSYALGKLAGKASISENLKQLGLVISPDLEKKILDKVIEMGDQGRIVSTEDLPFLIANLSGEDINHNFQILNCEVISGKGISPSAKLKVIYKSKEYSAEGKGDGGYDAFMDALRKIASANNIALPELLDYQVRIPPGGKTSALVETIITWSGSVQNNQSDSFRTIGLDSDQISAAILATEKMLNLILK